MARLLVAMRAQLRVRFALRFTGSQAEPGNPLQGGSASRNRSDVPHSGTRGRASQAVRSQAEPGNEGTWVARPCAKHRPGRIATRSRAMRAQLRVRFALRF